MNELARVLSLLEAWKEAKTTRTGFARERGLHPSAFSRLLKVGELPKELLSELASFERLSRTHLEVLAAAPAQHREGLLASIRDGRSTYALRERRERRAPPPAPEGAREPQDREALALARALGSSPEETRSFALELLSVLMASSPERVRQSLDRFRAQRSKASSEAPPR